MEKLDDIRTMISDLKGKEVKVVTREQRGKIDVYEGKIDSIYSNFFNLKRRDCNHLQMSFNYADILTSEIVIESSCGSIIENTPE